MSYTLARGECDSRGVLATRTRSSLVMKYGHPKFVEQCVDFSAPDKIGQNYTQTARYGAVLCTRERGERDIRCVLATRA